MGSGRRNGERDPTQGPWRSRTATAMVLFQEPDLEPSMEWAPNAKTRSAARALAGEDREEKGDQWESLDDSKFSCCHA